MKRGARSSSLSGNFPLARRYRSKAQVWSGKPNPQLVREAGSHCRSHPQRLVDLREIVEHGVERDHVDVVVEFLTEPVRQAREPAHVHAHGEVLTLHV